MGAAQVLAHLQAAGFRLHADGDRLTVAPASLLHDDDRNIIKAHKAGLLALLKGPPEPPETPRLAANDVPGTVGPAAATGARLARMARLAWREEKAQAAADRLERRDAEDDPRRMCIECSHLGDSGRCIAAATGRLRNADRRHEPVADLLQRCEAFGLRRGLS